MVHATNEQSNGTGRCETAAREDVAPESRLSKEQQIQSDLMQADLLEYQAGQNDGDCITGLMLCRATRPVLCGPDGSMDPLEPDAVEIEQAYRLGYRSAAEYFKNHSIAEATHNRSSLRRERLEARVAAESLSDDSANRLELLAEQARTRGSHQANEILCEAMIEAEDARGWFEDSEQLNATVDVWMDAVSTWASEDFSSDDLFFAFAPNVALMTIEALRNTRDVESDPAQGECESATEMSVADRLNAIMEEDADEPDQRFTLDSLPEESACEVTRAFREFVKSNYSGSALDEILEHCYARRWTSYEAPCLATAMAAVSALASWNYRSASADPNLYVILTGDTSTGKNMPIIVVPEILRRCGAYDRIASKPASSQMFNEVFATNSAPCLVWDEIGAGVQARDKTFQLGFTETVNTLYTSARSSAVPLPTAKKDTVEKIGVCPHPTIVASSTPVELVNAFAGAAVSQRPVPLLCSLVA